MVKCTLKLNRWYTLRDVFPPEPFETLCITEMIDGRLGYVIRFVDLELAEIPVDWDYSDLEEAEFWQVKDAMLRHKPAPGATIPG